MSPQARRYSSELRDRQAEATRQSILRAARRVFVRSGYQAATIEKVAAAARVSVPTIYLTFGSKVGILTTLVANAVGDPDIRAAADETRRETDLERRVEKAAHVMRLGLEREHELTELLWQAGSGNPELVAAWRQMHANRHRTLGAVLQPVFAARRWSAAERGAALDAAWVLGSPEVYRLLVTERGWLPELYEAWLAGAMVKDLLDRPLPAATE